MSWGALCPWCGRQLLRRPDGSFPGHKVRLGRDEPYCTGKKRERGRLDRFAARVVETGTNRRAVELARAYLELAAERRSIQRRLRGLLARIDTLIAWEAA